MVKYAPTFILLIGVAFMLCACNTEPQPINWGDYHPMVKERIDTAVANNDCHQLQIEFDSA